MCIFVATNYKVCTTNFNKQMKRKAYKKPKTQVVLLQYCSPLLSGSGRGYLPDSQDPKNEDWD